MTFGEKCADAVRSYLRTNGITQGKLTGKVLAELVDRLYAHDAALAKKRKRLATEEDWIKELESEPHLAEVNVRKELAAAQFWCKNNGRVCTRRMFVNWLNKAQTTAVINPGGKVPEKLDLYTEPENWRERAKGKLSGVSAETWAIICQRGWFDLGTDVRADILRALR